MQEVHSASELSECDREPVHLPGAIQPFGCLVAFQLPTWSITHASINAAALFGMPTDTIVGSAIGTILSPKTIHDLRNTFQAAMISAQIERLADVALGPQEARYDIFVHASGSLAIAECVPLAGADTARTDAASLVKTIIDRLRRPTTFKAFLTSAARQLRAITGYDRVMVYRFLEDDSGVVVAEALRSGMEPFLDLHYPATDIPAQSRALFQRQSMRMIPDIDYDLVPILASSADGQPLDLSLSMLRSVSPIHRQYLRNMGVRATMTASLIAGDRLWGLISCHHETPRRVSASTAAAVELFAQVFSTQVEGKEQRDELSYRLQSRDVHDRLVAAMQPEETILQNLRRFAPLLREMIPCDGLGVWSDGHFESDGAAPPAADVPELITFLNDQRADGCYATAELGKELPGAARYASDVSGLIAIPFARAPRDFLLLFRREIVQTFSWGGNPDKAVLRRDEAGALSPRGSFAAWQQTVRQRSLPWRASEREIAETLRVSMLDVILRRANLLDQERRTVQESQLVLVAELNHRVKNVLALVGSLVRQGQQSASTIDVFKRDLQARIHALAVAHDQLTLAHWKAAPLRGLIEAEARAWTEPGDGRLILEGPAVTMAARGYQSLALVLHELMTNAAKYGALSTDGGHLVVSWTMERTGDLALRWTERGGPTVTAPQRRGFGSIVVEKTIPYELRGEATIAYPPEGVEATFRIPAEYVQAEPQGTAVPEERPVPHRRVDLHGKSLLLVEDSMMIALDAQTMLQNCGADVELVANTRDARRAIELNRFDAAILDVNLYTETSFPIAEELQERAIPFVFATGYGETVTIPDRFKGVRVLSKPYAEDALRDALAA